MEEAFPINSPETEPSDASPRLISTRRRAIAALCFAGYFAARGYWSLLISHTSKASGWAFPFDSFWPNWVDAVLNLSFYGLFVCMLVMALTQLKNEERVYCAIWIAECLVPPIKALVPKATALGFSWAQLFGNVVMLVAAAIIYRNIRSGGIVVLDNKPTMPCPVP
jgi:hypothetical protein